MGVQPYSHLQDLFTHLALEKYSNNKGTGCWRQEGGTGAGTDYRVRLGTIQLTSAALVLAILAPRGDGDAGLRPELQGHSWGDTPPPRPRDEPALSGTRGQGKARETILEMFPSLELYTCLSLVPATFRSHGRPSLPWWPSGPSGASPGQAEQRRHIKVPKVR